MTVCIITVNEKVGRRTVELYWGVAIDEETARALVLDRLYKEGVSEIGDEWQFQTVTVTDSRRHRG